MTRIALAAIVALIPTLSLAQACETKEFAELQATSKVTLREEYCSNRLMLDAEYGAVDRFLELGFTLDAQKYIDGARACIRENGKIMKLLPAEPNCMQVFKAARCGKTLCNDAASLADTKKTLDRLEKREKDALDKAKEGQ